MTTQHPPIDLQFVQRVIADCQQYAKRFNCSLNEALVDWEGDGPSGSYGLTDAERQAVSVAMLTGMGKRVTDLESTCDYLEQQRDELLSVLQDLDDAIEMWRDRQDRPSVWAVMDKHDKARAAIAKVEG